MAKTLLKDIPQGGVVIFDRGYPSYELMRWFVENYQSGYFLMRCSTSSSYAEIDRFLNTQQNEAEIQIKPTSRFMKNNEGASGPVLTVRVIRMDHVDGTASVLLTNLHKKQFSYIEIKNLYYRRWEIESYDQDEKVTFDLQTFHTKTPNGIRQEFFCAATISVMARLLMMYSDLPSITMF